MSDFFEVGKEYLLAGYVYTIHYVIDCCYGPIAFSSFVRGGNLDVQMLIVPQFEEARELVPKEK